MSPLDVANVASESFTNTAAAFAQLSGGNTAASLTVITDGDVAFRMASGTTVSGGEATGDSPMVMASVSKLLVAMTIARLHESDVVDVAEPVPWGLIGLEPDSGWNDVTIRELLDHTSGLEKARYSWFTGEGTCRDYVPSLLTTSPNTDRGRWVYSNGNYCLLGLLVESATGHSLDLAVQSLVFDPIGANGVHLTDNGLQPGDIPYAEGVSRLSRLGGAGNLVISTNDLAKALDQLSPADRAVLQPPGVHIDQYGFGHTGTVSGAKACSWVLEGADTVLAAAVSGNGVNSGGDLCDIVVPAVASDVGLGSAKPDRTP